MYKLLIVDDEDIEREGMAILINWQEYQTEVVGTAWNGFDGLEKIEKLKPDIVITDVKMPVMNGIDLIRRAKKDFPDIVFVVLSGYGEYEFTSQAMEEGVRHYLLKPCDEDKIVKVLQKAQREVDEKRAQKRSMRSLLPRAREQIFRNLLLKRGEEEYEYQRFFQEIGGRESKVYLLAIRGKQSFDHLEQFVLENVLGELLGEEKILLVTVVREDCVFLMKDIELAVLEKAVERTREEFSKFKKQPVNCAVSERSAAENISELYEQIQGLFRMGTSEKVTGLLSRERFVQPKEKTEALLNLYRIKNAKDYADILQEIYLGFLKMDLRGETMEQKKATVGWMLKILYGEKELPVTEGGMTEQEMQWKLIEAAADKAAEYQNLSMNSTKEEQRVKSILLAACRYIQKPEMSLQFLAKDVLFINEDYAGRVFARNRKMRFSAFLLKQRIFLAKELIAWDPDIRISFLAEQLGYSFDGQYFSKVFRKETGMSPTEYRENIKRNL
ncbi:MAG: response regulator [Eubacteriales bacterium]|nr:response regulator [Eubacteriales bacterium]